MGLKSKIQTGFDSERWRLELFESGDLGHLKVTYSLDYPQIKDLNTPQFWDDKFASGYVEDFHIEQDRNQIVAQEFSMGDQVLNLGAGAGKLEELVWQRLGKRIKWTGTDFTQKTLRQLQKKFPAYDFVRTDLEKLPFAGNSFTHVCLIEVLEHIQPDKTFEVLEEIRRVLVPGGQLILSVPVNEGLEEMMPANPNAHVRVYAEKILAWELMEAGFEIEKVSRLSAFARHYRLKAIINRFLKLRQPNNLIFFARKN